MKMFSLDTDQWRMRAAPKDKCSIKILKWKSHYIAIKWKLFSIGSIKKAYVSLKYWTAVGSWTDAGCVMRNVRHNNRFKFTGLAFRIEMNAFFCQNSPDYQLFWVVATNDNECEMRQVCGQNSNEYDYFLLKRHFINIDLI